MDSSVALLIPCFNAAEHIARLIEQARAQTCPFAEIICYDDASADNTVEVVEGLGVTTIQGKTNQGPGFARNQLLKAATCDYVHFHDADDPFASDAFVEQLLPLASAKRVAFCQWSRVDESCSTQVYDYEDVDDSTDWVSYWIHRHVHLNAAIYPRQAMVDMGGFRSDFKTQQDLLLNMELSLSGVKFQLLRDNLAVHIRNAESHTANQDKERANTASLRLVETIFDNYPEQYRSDLGKKYIFHLKQLIDLRIDGALENAKPFLSKLEISDHGGGRMERLIAGVLGLPTALKYYRWRRSR